MAAEKNFEKRVVKYLTSLGIYTAGTPIQKKEVEQIGWFFKVWGGGFQKAGIPDLICGINGIFVSVELKGSKGKPSELQIHNTISINDSNCIGLILYPEGFEEFKNIISGVISCKYHIQELNYLKTANTSTKCDTLIN